MKTLKEKYPKELHLPDVARAISTIDLRSQFLKEQGGADAGDLKAKVNEYKLKLSKEPNDHKTRYDLAFSLFSVGQVRECASRALVVLVYLFADTTSLYYVDGGSYRRGSRVSQTR